MKKLSLFNCFFGVFMNVLRSDKYIFFHCNSSSNSTNINNIWSSYKLIHIPWLWERRTCCQWIFRKPLECVVPPCWLWRCECVARRCHPSPPHGPRAADNNIILLLVLFISLSLFCDRHNRQIDSNESSKMQHFPHLIPCKYTIDYEFIQKIDRRFGQWLTLINFDKKIYWYQV